MNYSQYSHDKCVNIIPEQDFKCLVSDTFKVLTENLKCTYGPYGSQVIMMEQNNAVSTKDGYNALEAMHFNHPYMRQVYITIKKICERVNTNVGDGTTSCILLAEKIFNECEDRITSPEDKRLLMEELTRIETSLTTMESDLKRPLTAHSLNNIISLSSSGDKKLTSMLFDAFSPTLDENGNVVKLRNVVPEVKNSYFNTSQAKFDVAQVPGNYHISTKFFMVEDAEAILNGKECRVVLYDHAFSNNDWECMAYKEQSEVPIMIIARDYQKTFMDMTYTQWCMTHRASQPIYLVWIRGDVQKEIRDLGAMLKADVHYLAEDKVFDVLDVPKTVVQSFNGNTLCFNFTEEDIPTKYLDNVKKEYEAEDMALLSSRMKLKNRINALSLKSEDTTIQCFGGSSLETQMMMDKIDDCVSIVNSAKQFGVVSNMLRYGFEMVDKLEEDNAISTTVKDILKNSIKSLFMYVYRSKYPSIEQDDEKMNSIIDKFYNDNMGSYDIISEQFVDGDELPTSAQYDIEVITAAISIVKYLSTAKVFIFEASSMAPMMQF